MPDPILVAALWVVGGLAAAWLVAPVVVAACGGTTYANGGTEDQALAEPDGTDPDYADLYDEFVALGYEPLGVGFMRVRFLRPRYWGFRSRVWAFRSPAAGAFAFVQRSPLYPGVPQPFVATCWADGGLLLTAAGAGDGQQTRAGYTLQVVPSFRPAELDRRHREAADEERAAGRRPDPDRSLAALLRATGRHAAPPLKEQARAAARQDLWAVPALVGVPAALAAVLGPAHWAGPLFLLGVLAVVGLLSAYERVVLPARNRRLFRAEREDADPGW